MNTTTLLRAVLVGVLVVTLVGATAVVSADTTMTDDSGIMNGQVGDHHDSEHTEYHNDGHADTHHDGEQAGHHAEHADHHQQDESHC